MPNDAVMPTEIVVTLKGDEFHFKIPAVFDEIRLGQRCRDIRKRAYPEGDGSDIGLDEWTNLFVRACAVFELLLTKASTKWPYSSGKGGPVVDASQFPADKTDQVVDIHLDFSKQLNSFRTGGNPAQPPADEEAVAGQSGS